MGAGAVEPPVRYVSSEAIRGRVPFAVITGPALIPMKQEAPADGRGLTHGGG